ncbi:MAG: class A sortase [Streptococcaceae bacterium]|nr:class A sortase [Streptococcaceae bacterium]
MKKKKLSVVWGSLVILLFVIVAGFFYNQQTGSKTKAVTKVFSSSHIVKSSSTQVINQNAYLSAMGARATNQPLPVIGQIAIPNVKVNLPIFQDSGATQILYGAGTVDTDSIFGGANFALASHHVFDIAGAETYLFSPLTGSQIGMMIYVTDKTYVYQYKVDNIFVVQDTDLSVLDPVQGKQVITLIYCVNPSGPDRAIIRGSLISKTPFSETNPTVKGYFTADFNQVPADIVGILQHE